MSVDVRPDEVWTALAIVAAFIAGFVLRELGEWHWRPAPLDRVVHTPPPPAEAPPIRSRSEVEAWLGGPWRVPVEPHDLPPFVQDLAFERGLIYAHYLGWNQSVVYSWR